MSKRPQDAKEVRDFEDLETNEVPKNEWGLFGEYELVGHGSITDPKKCGNFRGFVGCLNVDLHGVVKLDGSVYKGEVYVKKQFHSCDKPTCPICF
jgi:hypothetical protein